MWEKSIIVEGKSDKIKLQKILAEKVEIVCTYGTLSEEKLAHLIRLLRHREVYILVDADQPGNKLRRQLKREFPNARHLYTRSMYREVAGTPDWYLAELLLNAHFIIHEQFLLPE